MRGPVAFRTHMLARLVFFCTCILGTSTLTHECGELGGGGTDFNEELLLRPLPDGRIAAHFSFSQHLNHPENPTSFPKPIIQLAQDRGFAHAELAFGRGRWHAKKWGQPLLRTISSGAQLLASFKRDALPAEVQTAWTNLTHRLGAIFCGSLAFLENGPARAQPIFSPFHGLYEAEHVHRYGALPREMLCTENLTPWLKLLPCRDRAGLGILLQESSRILDASYQALHVAVSASPDGSVHLRQSLVLVLKTGPDAEAPSAIPKQWTLSSVLGGALPGACAAAVSSHVYVEIEAGLLASIPGGTDPISSVAVDDNVLFGVTPTPDSIIERGGGGVGVGAMLGGTTLLDWSLQSRRISLNPLDVHMKWRLTPSWTPSPPPIYVSQYLTGVGTAYGDINIELQRSEIPSYSVEDTLAIPLQIRILHVAPWFMKIWWHALLLEVDGTAVAIEAVPKSWAQTSELHRAVELQRVGSSYMHLTPSTDREAPGVAELFVHLPAGAASARLSVPFDKAFLHVDEHMPDANHGFDIEGAMVTVELLHTPAQGKAIHEQNWSETSAFPTSSAADSIQNRALLVQLKALHYAHTCTDGVLTVLSTPDFSMPYNVLTFSSTVVALLFGAFLNMMLRRPADQDRAKSATETKDRPVQRFWAWWKRADDSKSKVE